MEPAHASAIGEVPSSLSGLPTTIHLLHLFEQAPGFVAFLRGPELVFELANKAYFAIVGHRDILGRPLCEALPEIEGQGFVEILSNIFVTGEPFVGRGMPVMLQREPGATLTEAIVDFIYQPIRSGTGEVIGILAQGHEVTALKWQEHRRREAEAALKASEERYRTLFESIDDGFCLMQMLVDAAGETVDYRFLEANAAFEAHTGLHDAVGKTARTLVPNLDASWFRLYGKVASTGEPTRFENHAPSMNRWFEVYATRVGRPELLQVALVFKDITARKLVEEDRERARRERELLLASETAARRDAEEAGRLREEFLAMVSHELRTPLNAILGWVQMLRSGSLTIEKGERALEAIERNARSQAQLIDDLLDVSRILAGTLRLDIAPTHLESMIDAALDTVRPAAAAKGVRLEKAPTENETVRVDGQRVQQVIWNLLSNAVKFTPRGGVVRVSATFTEAAFTLSVTDTGKGIPQDFQPFVFERFRQAEGGTTRSHGGLGLGLSIVRQIVELHGGTVGVASEGEGRGATFTVRIPVAAADAAATDPPRAIDASPTSIAPGFEYPRLDGLHVLLVDDEEDTREMLRTLLEGCGVRVRAAGSAEEALQLLDAERPDLLLSDIGMPGQDGYSLIERVRQLPAAGHAALPAIAITAYARTEDRTRALLAGFTSHVSKPVEPLELVAVVSALSDRGRPRRPA